MEPNEFFINDVTDTNSPVEIAIKNFKIIQGSEVLRN